METIKGRFDKIVYEGENNWTVFLLWTNIGKVKATGNLIDAKIGDNLSLTGDWVDHKDHGPQFKFDSYDIIMPVTNEGVIGFLESHLWSVGRARAIEMVNHFGADKIFDIIEYTPSRLVEISGITMDRADRIHLEYMEIKSLRDTITFLKQFRLTDNQVSKIINAYGKKTVKVIKQDPYQLIEDIPGFGFKIVDAFAIRMGVNHNGLPRSMAGCLYVLREAKDKGHTYLPHDEFIHRAVIVLETKTDIIEEAIKLLSDNLSVVIEHDRIYDAVLHRLECSVAEELISMAKDSNYGY